MVDGCSRVHKCVGLERTRQDTKIETTKIEKRKVWWFRMKTEKIHGYYYDGETQWVMIEDEDGYIEMREMEDDDE